MEVMMTREERIEILSVRDGYSCYMCPKPFDNGRHRVTIDHVVPLARGGTWDISNLKLAGFSCNQEKADRLWLEDGTLEPRNVRVSYAARKAEKTRILSEFCELCYDGRLLLPEENCPECDRGAVAFPWSTKQEPKNCSHSGIDWCWCCSIGIYQREPAIVSVLDGGILEETDGS